MQVTSGDVSVIYQGDVILGRLAMGADYLNPAACCELSLALLLVLLATLPSDLFLISYWGVFGRPFFLSITTMPVTYAASTELDAVNQILSSVGQAPVTTLDLQNPEVAIVLTTLTGSK